MNTRRVSRSLAAAAALAAVLGLQPSSARADDAHPQGGLSVGARGSYYKPQDADGSWTGGAQVRFHFGPVVTLEGATDYRQDRVGGSDVDVFPVQASLLFYLLPQYRLSPYILGGGGWYYTHVHGGSTDNTFGPHAGAGAEFFLTNHWSVDGSYRYIWLSDYKSQTQDHPLGTNIRRSGHQVTAAVNYRF